MKKIYIIATLSVASLAFSQNSISFEAAEGYALGDINEQKGWTVSEKSDGFIKKQVITNELASQGSFSFKNAYESDFGEQFMPIIGAEKSFASPLDYKDTTISYDFLANMQGKSDFEFAVYAIDKENQAFDTLFALGFDNRGYIYLFPKKNFEGFTYATPTWKVNQWYNIKIVISETNYKFYLDNVEIYNGENDGKANIVGINMLHNNYKGDAYYDNFKINDVDLATFEAQQSNILKIYPNPAKDFVTIENKEKIASYSIFSMAGQKVLDGATESRINVQALPKGQYLVKVTTADNKVYTTKLIKQ